MSVHAASSKMQPFKSSLLQSSYISPHPVTPVVGGGEYEQYESTLPTNSSVETQESGISVVGKGWVPPRKHVAPLRSKRRKSTLFAAAPPTSAPASWTPHRISVQGGTGLDDAHDNDAVDHDSGPGQKVEITGTGERSWEKRKRRAKTVHVQARESDSESEGLDVSSSEKSSDSESEQTTGSSSSEYSSGEDDQGSASASEGDSSDSQDAPSERASTNMNVKSPSARLEVIYCRLPSALSREKKAKVKDALTADHPNAKVLLDMQPRKSRFAERQRFEQLLQLVLADRVSTILIASTAHVCNTKEAFQLFEWICSMHGAEVHIVQRLELC
jgi:hypothetical protein